MRSNPSSLANSWKSRFSKVSRTGSTGPASMLLESLDRRQMMSATGVTADVVSTSGGPVLEVHGTMSADVIAVSQSGGSLTVYDGGVAVGTYTGVGEVDVFAGKGADYINMDPSVTIATCLHGGRGADTILGGSGANTLYGGKGANLLNAGAGSSLIHAGEGDNDTLVAIGGGEDTLVGGSGQDNFWVAQDSGSVVQNFHAGDCEQDVAGFQSYDVNVSGSIVTETPDSQTLFGKRFQEPGVPDGRRFAGWADEGQLKLFAADGPTASDIQQGSLSDCYFVSTMAGIAKSDPAMLRHNITALGDGTFAVMFMQNGTPTYYRVDGLVPADKFGDPVFERLSSDQSTWSLIYEKAWAEARHPNSPADYGNIELGNLTETFEAFGVSATSTDEKTAVDFDSDGEMLNWIQTNINKGRAVEFGTNSILPEAASAILVPGHAYTVIGLVTDSSGNISLVLRNPWGNGSRTMGGPEGIVDVPATSLAGTYSSVVAATF